MRHITALRKIYSFYSCLGYEESPDNTYIMSRMQFWRLLKDCRLHSMDTSLMQMDRVLGETPPPPLSPAYPMSEGLVSSSGSQLR